MNCRHCRAELCLPFIDLGTAPPSNAYLSPAQLDAPEAWYPLRVFTCTTCWLVQTQDYAHHAELFSNEYGYFSAMSDTWVAHAKAYVDAMVVRFGLTPESHVVEVAANDGYLLQHVRHLRIPCLGIEPTGSTAQAAREKGITIRQEFFGIGCAQQLVADGLSADLMAANNVLAHVPDINDFVAGFAHALKPAGVATFEFPHLLQLVQHAQFDTIYHEHFSYLSLTAVQRIFDANGLQVFDVQELPTHGGSLRLFAQRQATGTRGIEAAVPALLAREHAAGVTTEAFYAGLQPRACRIKDDFVAFLIDAKRNGKTVMAYGAAAKGNTLLNFAGVRGDLIACAADRSPGKQGLQMPGSRIPIVAESVLREAQPDHIVILPWNLKDEVTTQLAYAREWGATFVVAVPALQVF